jgi:PPM family protein phosphatase
MKGEISKNYFVKTHQGLVRKNNEDYFGQKDFENFSVYIVCDGVGGHTAGEKASQMVVEKLLYFFETNTTLAPQQLLSDAFKYVNQSLIDYALLNNEYKGMGTTCVVLFINKQHEIFLAHLGDSRIYLYENQQLKRLTKDHSYVQMLVDLGEISQDEAQNHPAKNRILKHLGTQEIYEPSISELIVGKENQCYLLCTDGLSDMVNDDKIAGILKNQENINDDTVKKLIDEALSAGGKDNVTAGLLVLGDNFKNEKSAASFLQSIKKLIG